MPDTTTADAVMARFGRRIHDLRKQHKMTLSDLAVLTTVSQPTLSRIERGADATIGTAAELAQAFSVPLESLLCPCWRCGDQPPAGYTCNACGTVGDA